MPDTAELRILHWNIHSWTDETGHSNRQQVTDLITDVKPHVVSLVEVDEPLIGPSTLNRIAAATGYHSVFIPAFEYGTDQSHGQFGNAILSREAVLDVRHHHLIWPPPTYHGTEPSEPRSLLLARVQTSAEPVWIGTTHLPRSDQATRIHAARHATSIMSRLPAPWLLIGDFNMPAEKLDPGLDPSLSAYPQAPTPTYPTSNPTEPIDYCIAPRSQPVRVDALKTPGSDHLPILARVEITTRAR
jgi:endonuclease/exonuclease/phosphatase family metal-dependent hydrolase